MEITVKFEENSCSFDARFYDSAILEPVNVTPNGREIVVKPNERIDGFSQVTVEGDKNLKPENIVSGVTIYGVTGTREDEGAVLTPITVVPTGTDFTEYPRFDGFSEVTVAGDINLEPQNIAAGVTIYGVEGTLLPGATSDIPEVYLPFVEHALLLFTGEYENMAILEWHEHLAVVFMMSDFTVTDYNATTTEFKAQGWVSCSFNKLHDNWTFTDWRDTPSTGGNYVMNIRYSSVYWYYNGQIIWPFGMSGGGGESGGGGGAWLESSATGRIPDYDKGYAISTIFLNFASRAYS